MQNRNRPFVEDESRYYRSYDARPGLGHGEEIRGVESEYKRSQNQSRINNGVARTGSRAGADGSSSTVALLSPATQKLLRTVVAEAPPDPSGRKPAAQDRPGCRGSQVNLKYRT